MSGATNLLGDGTGGAVFVRDRNAGATSLVTRYGGPLWSVSNDGRFAGGGLGYDYYVDNDAPPACTGSVPMGRPLITLDGGHMRIRTNLVMPPGTFDPMSRGVQLVLEDMGSNAFGIYDLSYRTVPIQPAPSASCGPDDGWSVKHAGLDQRYRNESNALRGPSCVFGTAHGLYDVRPKDARATHGRVSFRAKARGGPLALPIGALRMTVVLAGD